MPDSVKIKQISFSSLEPLKSFSWANNWPTVYIINGKNEAYIGETNKVIRRLEQHKKNNERTRLTEVSILIDKEANKSYTLDIESYLIRYMSADNKFKLQNGNNGLVNYNYYNKENYLLKFKNQIWPKLKRLNLVNNSIEFIENSDLFKFSPYTSLDAYQYDVVELLREELYQNKTGGNILIRGGPGTGKTLIAVYLMKLLHLKDHHFEDEEIREQYLAIQQKIKNIALVIPQSSLRKTLKRVFRDIDGLSSKMVISPHEAIAGKYDLILVDEAHRLRRRKNITNYGAYDELNKKHGFHKEATELDWILSNSKYQIFFYDQFQSVKPTDIPVYDFEKKTNPGRLNVFTLQTQFRVQGGDDYIEYIKNILESKQADKKTFPEYELKLFSSFRQLKNKISEKNNEFGLSRIIAGYGWKWISKDNKSFFDIELDGEKINWNSVAIDWVHSENSLHEVGCIHTIQGYDLNYAGVIFGPEIYLDKTTNKIKIQKENYHDRNGKAGVKSEDELEQYIKNIYFVLMTRAIKGTYIYVCDDALRNYLANYFEKEK